MYKIERIITDNCILGESPIWSNINNTLYFVDINGKKLYSVLWKDKSFCTKLLPQKSGCIVLDNNEHILFAMEDGIYDSKYNLIHQKISISGERFNDGKIGPDGAFIVGTIDHNGKGKLYRLQNRIITCILNNIYISNGIDWSPDCKTIYYCDTYTHKIFGYDYPLFKNKRLIIDIPKQYGNPDGLCVDEQNNLWIALWGGAAVIKVSSKSGTILEKVTFPATKISCPCFAGPSLDYLVVTSASENIDLNNEPFAGNTFMIKTNTHGKNPTRYGRNINE